MSTRKIALLNTGSAIFQQFVNVIVQFVVRKFLLVYLGVEILGINSTLASVVAAAALAESGATNVIVFKLYSAVQKNDEEDINSLVNITRFYMMIIAIVVSAITFILLPFVPRLLTNIEISPKIYLYFILQSAATVASYLLAYKRVLLTADRVVYIGTFADIVTNIIFSALKIWVVVAFKSYEWYLIICVAQVIVGNVLIHLACKNKYAFLRYQRADLKRLVRMLPEFKDLFMGSLAAYLYKSSDNLVISKFVDTVSVGYLGNYTTITSALKSFALAVMSTMGPILGNKAVNKEDSESLKKAFRFYDFMLYVIAMAIVIPEYVLLKGFVSYVWGADYVMSDVIAILLIIDQYLVLVQDCNGVMLSVVGRFKELKVADGTAAILNLIISIALVFNYGIEGVLLGTIISRMVQWVLKAYYCRIKYMGDSAGAFVKYWMKNFAKATIAFITVLLTIVITNEIFIHHFFVEFVIVGLLSEIITGIVLILFGAITRDLFVSFNLVGINR